MLIVTVPYFFRQEKSMDIFVEFLLYLLYGIGAFLSCAVKGFKTEFEDELSDNHKI